MTSVWRESHRKQPPPSAFSVVTSIHTSSEAGRIRHALARRSCAGRRQLPGAPVTRQAGVSCAIGSGLRWTTSRQRPAAALGSCFRRDDGSPWASQCARTSTPPTRSCAGCYVHDRAVADGASAVDQPVADAPYVDDVAASLRVELAAQAGGVGVQGAGAAHRAKAPDVSQELVLAEGPGGLGGELT